MDIGWESEFPQTERVCIVQGNCSYAPIPNYYQYPHFELDTTLVTKTLHTPSQPEVFSFKNLQLVIITYDYLTVLMPIFS